MGRPSDKPGFKALLKKWNQKLAESGLVDVEELREGDLKLKQTGSSNRYKACDQLIREAKVEYFSIISKRMAETVFEVELEQKIMTLYCEGISQAEIKRKLKIVGHRSRVYRPIYRWLKLWRLKR